MVPGAHVAIIFLGLYYAGQGAISKILYQDPLLVEVKVIEVSPMLKVEIPFPIRDLQRTSQYTGRDVIWEAKYLQLYGALSEEPLELLDGLPTPAPEDVRPVEEFLTLVKRMVIALLNTDALSLRCDRIGIIEEFSPKEVWSDFIVLHSFFVIVRLQIMNWEYKNHAVHYESPNLQTLRCVVK